VHEVLECGADGVSRYETNRCGMKPSRQTVTSKVSTGASKILYRKRPRTVTFSGKKITLCAKYEAEGTRVHEVIEGA